MLGRQLISHTTSKQTLVCLRLDDVEDRLGVMWHASSDPKPHWVTMLHVPSTTTTTTTTDYGPPSSTNIHHSSNSIDDNSLPDSELDQYNYNSIDSPLSSYNNIENTSMEDHLFSLPLGDHDDAIYPPPPPPYYYHNDNSDQHSIVSNHDTTNNVLPTSTPRLASISAALKYLAQDDQLLMPSYNNMIDDDASIYTLMQTCDPHEYNINATFPFLVANSSLDMSHDLYIHEDRLWHEE